VWEIRVGCFKGRKVALEHLSLDPLLRAP